MKNWIWWQLTYLRDTEWLPFVIVDWIDDLRYSDWLYPHHGEDL